MVLVLRMKSVVAAVVGLSLGGCATVAVVPTETTVSTEATVEQSALRTSADLFCEKAEAEGWVASSSGLLGFASVLMNGAGTSGERPGTYADRIDAGSNDASVVVERIATDATTARDGLLSVKREADVLIASETSVPDRIDVMAFERALVRAQRSSRGFSEALEIVSGRTEETSAGAAAIAAFDEAIDGARRIADALDTRYANEAGSAPIS